MTSPEVIFKSGTPAFLTPHTILKHITKRNQTLPNLLDCYVVCPAYKDFNIVNVGEHTLKSHAKGIKLPRKGPPAKTLIASSANSMSTNKS